MKKNILLYILLGFLVIMNGFFLFNHFNLSDQREHRRPATGNFIAKELAFGAEQLQEFEKLDRAHRESMDAIRSDIRVAKDVLFDKFTDQNSDATEIDSLARIVADEEVKKELETYRFFKAVSEICNEGQKLRFKAIIKDALHRQGPPRQDRRPPEGPGNEGRPPPPGGPGEEGRRPPPKL